jgi:hypothetical protein
MYVRTRIVILYLRIEMTLFIRLKLRSSIVPNIWMRLHNKGSLDLFFSKLLMKTHYRRQKLIKVIGDKCIFV